MPKNQRFTERDGHRLFAGMLRDTHRNWFARPGCVPQQLDTAWKREANDGAAVRRRIESALTGHSAVAKGFFIAMAEYIGSAEDGIKLSPDFFERRGNGGQDG